MNKFRKLSYISYDGGFTVHRSLLSVVLDDLNSLTYFFQLPSSEIAFYHDYSEILSSSGMNS